MFINLDLQSEVPIYQQLRRQIIEGIAVGAIKPGEALPSVRQFAEDLGINLHTVNKTYNILKQDGFILVHRQKGVVVNPEQGAMVNSEYLGQLHGELRAMIAEAYCRGMHKEEFESICLEIFDKLKIDGGEK